ncbi:DUF4256 domain-containing protein [Candidatus Gracilibacteria bacterium]|jgi:hypothetical protein|nr:DUF4256 domain-containing protein [Candidatus Gracilibacteria bacterium]
MEQQKGVSKRALNVEEAQATLATFGSIFNDPENQKFHNNIEWSKVKAALENDLEALASLASMIEKGHCPKVYITDEEGFDFGTCTDEAPEHGRNCVYDPKAAANVKENFPDTEFNSDAETIAAEMDVNLMSPDQYLNELQRIQRFDQRSSVWLKTDPDMRDRPEDRAMFGYGGIEVSGVLPHASPIASSWHTQINSLRCSKRVKWVN